jgi:hypothetical protein
MSGASTVNEALSRRRVEAVFDIAGGVERNPHVH